jgi:hypothetical protein
LNSLQETITLFDNPRVALERRELTARPAVENGHGIGQAKDVAILRSAVGGSTARHDRQRRSAEIATRRVLAKIDLHAINLGRNPEVGRTCGRIYTRNDNPLTA